MDEIVSVPQNDRVLELVRASSEDLFIKLFVFLVLLRLRNVERFARGCTVLAEEPAQALDSPRPCDAASAGSDVLA